MKDLPKFLVAAIIVALPAFAQAAPVIDFGTGFGGAGGTVTLGQRDGIPGTWNITGQGIFIDTITVSGAGQNGVFDVEGIGACADLAGGCGLLSFDLHRQTLELAGSIPELGIFDPVSLVIGLSFNGFGSAAQDVDGVRLGLGSGTDIKDASLLAALGIDPATFSLGLSITGINNWSPFTGIPPTAEYLVTSTSLTNTPATFTPVPEPGSVVLLGTGLIAVMRARRRKR